MNQTQIIEHNYFKFLQNMQINGYKL